MVACSQLASYAVAVAVPRSRERGWKLKQCKRHATAVSKSNLSIEARVAAREKQEAEAIRKKASFVAKQVCVWVYLLKERSGLLPQCLLVQPSGARRS